MSEAFELDTFEWFSVASGVASIRLALHDTPQVFGMGRDGAFVHRIY